MEKIHKEDGSLRKSVLSAGYPLNKIHAKISALGVRQSPVWWVSSLVCRCSDSGGPGPSSAVSHWTSVTTACTHSVISAPKNDTCAYSFRVRNADYINASFTLKSFGLHAFSDVPIHRFSLRFWGRQQCLVNNNGLVQRKIRIINALFRSLCWIAAEYSPMFVLIAALFAISLREPFSGGSFYLKTNLRPRIRKYRETAGKGTLRH